MLRIVPFGLDDTHVMVTGHAPAAVPAGICHVQVAMPRLLATCLGKTLTVAPERPCTLGVHCAPGDVWTVRVACEPAFTGEVTETTLTLNVWVAPEASEVAVRSTTRKSTTAYPPNLRNVDPSLLPPINTVIPRAQAQSRQGRRYQQKSDKAGTFNYYCYYCRIHGGPSGQDMSGVVIVK